MSICQAVYYRVVRAKEGKQLDERNAIADWWKLCRTNAFRNTEL